MRRVLIGLVGCAGIAALLMSGVDNTKAADHGDSPNVGVCDIGDLYSWMTTDAGKVVMVATMGGGFSDTCQYVFHVNSQSAFGEARTATMVVCQYDAEMHCWVGNPGESMGGDSFQAYVTGAADVTNSSDDGAVDMFYGMRDDPFFFNGEGFNATVDAVIAAAGGLTFDADGCPALDANTSNTLVTQLQTTAAGAPAVDNFAGTNTSALVIELDKTLVNSGGDILAIWASTRER